MGAAIVAFAVFGFQGAGGGGGGVQARCCACLLRLREGRGVRIYFVHAAGRNVSPPARASGDELGRHVDKEGGALCDVLDSVKAWQRLCCSCSRSALSTRELFRARLKTDGSNSPGVPRSISCACSLPNVFCVRFFVCVLVLLFFIFFYAQLLRTIRFFLCKRKDAVAQWSRNLQSAQIHHDKEVG